MQCYESASATIDGEKKEASDKALKVKRAPHGGVESADTAL